MTLMLDILPLSPVRLCANRYKGKVINGGSIDIYASSMKHQLAGARSRGMLLDTLFRRGRSDVLTPPPPAGPQVYSAVTSRSTRSDMSFCARAHAIRSRTPTADRK